MHILGNCKKCSNIVAKRPEYIAQPGPSSANIFYRLIHEHFHKPKKNSGGKEISVDDFIKNVDHGKLSVEIGAEGEHDSNMGPSNLRIQRMTEFVAIGQMIHEMAR